MAHEFFDELRSPACKLPSSNPMPVLFDFSDHELSIEPHLNSKLIPQCAVPGSTGSGSLSGLGKDTINDDTNLQAAFKAKSDVEQSDSSASLIIRTSSVNSCSGGAAPASSGSKTALSSNEA